MGDVDPHVLGKDLRESPLASVLITALKQKVTGELAMRHSEGEDLVYFQAGIPTGTQCSARSSRSAGCSWSSAGSASRPSRSPSR